ncbi:sigma 54-interacting transcriptional regulator [Bombilactobacillus bombi]|uniref:sigma 54-interacting transcriptional regulator n=1 Tax=Bombilactobacillus bombi TaxID=1303590 RepID=UPI0015E5E017|nr:sigma 54-interacting transcriptional regulator [Bombilactobacillus bombi]MBA1433648.1 PRD domain-containing protein [Bombilactobacillus bombi]
MIEQQISTILKQLTATSDWLNQRISAVFLCNKLHVKRNTVSHYLNILYKRGQAIKINSRPVIFWDKRVLEETYQVRLKADYGSISELKSELKRPQQLTAFDKVIGNKQSLYNPILKLKAAAGYPPLGLPVLLTGPTGSGKSFLAHAYYDYCVDKGLLNSDARFVYFNCAEYADNPELLTSNLFGYKKGAFTGAHNDSMGLFDEADGGMLFLDEIHRLSPKGQEKLFNYLDNGQITPLGETHKGHKVQVRLIFATTEDIKSHFLDTFLRRIPIQVVIPKLNDRTSQEKESLIKLFYLRQAKIINKTILLNSSILKLLVTANYPGNVGELENDILISVANALQTNTATAKQIKILLTDMSINILKQSMTNPNILNTNNQYIIISPQDTMTTLLYKTQTSNDEFKKYFLKIFALDIQNNHTKFVNHALTIINSLCDFLIFDKSPQNNNLALELFKNFFKHEIANLENIQQIHLNGNTALVLSYYFYNRQFSNWTLSAKEEKIAQKIITYLQKVEPNIKLLSNRILSALQKSLNFYSDKADELFIVLYLKSIIKNINRLDIHCLVLAHGYSTASSIANVVNNMQKEHIIDAIDMPLDIEIQEIGAKVNNYIQNRHINSGLILMVDMGSLEGIKKYIDETIDFPIGIVNNVSTQSVLTVSQDINQHHDLQKIMNSLAHISPTTQIIYPQEVKKNLIITCCLTGLGTADQIRKLLLNSMPKDLNIEIKPFEVKRLQDIQQITNLKKVYNIITIVGTVNPKLKNIPYIALESIISGKKTQLFNEILSHYMTNQQLQQFSDELIHNFSLERVINSMTILDVNIVMKNIDEAMRSYAIISGHKLSNITRMSLYVHVSCLIERLIRNEPITTYDNHLINDTKAQKQFNQIKKAFSVIEDKYSVKIPNSEYGYIYDIISAEP